MRTYNNVNVDTLSNTMSRFHDEVNFAKSSALGNVFEAVVKYGIVSAHQVKIGG